MHVEEQTRHLESLDEVRRVDNKTETDDNVDLKSELVSEVSLSSSFETTAGLTNMILDCRQCYRIPRVSGGLELGANPKGGQ